MKVFLYNSQIVVKNATAPEPEDRHKVSANGTMESATTGAKWTDETATSFFVDAKVGDEIVMQAKEGVRCIGGLTASNEITIGETIEFANGETARRRSSTGQSLSFSITENCYLWVLKVQSGVDYTPSSITINGETLNDDGTLG